MKRIEWVGSVCFAAAFGLLMFRVLDASHPGASHDPLPADIKKAVQPLRTGPDLLTESPGVIVVSGAGDSSYDGTYAEAGTCNGQIAYALDDEHWLWFCRWRGPTFDRGWVFSSARGDYDLVYCSCDPSFGPDKAQYFAQPGAEPVPEVAFEPLEVRLGPDVGGGAAAEEGEECGQMRPSETMEGPMQ